MSIEITPVTELALRQLVGPGAGAALANADLPRPADLCALGHDDGFVACLGPEAYLLAGRGEHDMPADAPPWCFSRSDCVLRLTGDAVFDLLTEFCAADVTPLADGGWLLTRLAGIDVWIYRAPNDGPSGETGLLIGCDASYERYLHDALRAAVPTAATQHA